MKRINTTIVLSVVLFCFSFHTSFGQGARYTGEYKKSPAILHVDKKNIVIEGLEFSDISGDIIGLYSCENVIIKNNKFSNSNKRGIYLYNCKNVTIIDNTFEHVRTALTASVSKEVKFEYNDIFNVGGLLADSDDTENGFVAQFIYVTGPGNSISYNVAENIFGDSSPGDLVNVNQSHGTPESPIMVKGNWFRGGGPSHSGGGILIGDIGGSYQIAEDNILVNPGQYGMGIGGGHNMTLRNNKVYAKQQYFTNVGYSICNWYENELGKSHSITFENNLVNYTNRDGISGNSWWIYENMEPVKGKETNRYDPTLNASILPEQLLGRARAGSPTDPDDGLPDGGSTPLPGEGDNEPGEGDNEPGEGDNEPGEGDNEPGEGDNEPGEGDNEPENPGFQLPEITNDPSITIYLNRYDRVCVNIWGRITPSAVVMGANAAGELIYQQRLTQFHTVLPGKAVPGTYYVYVKNGDKEHLKTFHIR